MDFLGVVVVVGVLALLRGAQGKGGPDVPALIVFGDSIVDPGNNNDLGTLIKCNFPPYGDNFYGGEPTGRFSNGKIPTDMMASRLGIKELLPPYLGAELSDQDILTGVSFASGGAGYDPLTPSLVSVISMEQQIELFKEYKERLRAIAGDEKAAYIISNAVYLSCAGSDDVGNTYFGTPFRRAEYDSDSYTDLVLSYMSSFVQNLIELGARKITVTGIPPIGCVPSQRTIGGGFERDCVAEQNSMAELINAKLQKELQRLSQSIPGTVLVYFDIYNPLLDIILHPDKYGFGISTEGCCGTGLLEVTMLCNSITADTCANVSDYVFWDSYHPTQRAYEILADFIYDSYSHYLY